MAQRPQKKQSKPVRPQKSKDSKHPVPPALFSFDNFRLQSLFLALVGVLIYFNSIYNPQTGRFNKYALDDDIVMRLNDYVQQGFDGIYTIMTTDAYDSFFKSMGSAGELSGGRYRPLSIVTFAIEQELFGETHGTRMLQVRDSLVNPALQQLPNTYNRLLREKVELEGKISQSHDELAMIRHSTSVFLYVLSVLFLFYLLREYLFKYANLKWVNYKDLAFFTSLIFMMHPIHTEVVANIKSRDEIMSMFFIVLTFIYLFRHFESKENKDLIWGLVFYFLALLSKEWGITLVVLVPLAFYLFLRQDIGKSIRLSIPYIGVAVFYLLIRSMFVGAGKQGEITEVLNNPFVFAEPAERVATQIYILIKYIALLIFPHPLSADYSWKTIPYNHFGDPKVWLSIIVYAVIIYYFFVLYKRKNWMAWAIAFYLGHLALISNLLMPIGATMGERLVYHSSLGFAMLAGYFLLWLVNKYVEQESLRKLIFPALMLVTGGAMGYQTVNRNPNWETDNILFVHDAWVVPNSVLANGNAGKAFIEYSHADTANRMALLDSAIYHLDKAVKLHPKYVNGYLNLGLAWFQKKDLDKTEYNWAMARKYFPTHPFLHQSYFPALSNAFVDKARIEGARGNVPNAIEFMAKALQYDSTKADTWYHYGGANYSVGNMNEAYRGWNKCLQINPEHPEARKGLEMLRQRLMGVPQGDAAQGQ